MMDTGRNVSPRAPAPGCGLRKNRALVQGGRGLEVLQGGPWPKAKGLVVL